MKKSRESTAERFDEKSKEYDDTRSDHHHESVRIVREHARTHISKSDTILDIGAGTGMVALELAAYAGEVIALDISEGMLEEGRQKAENRGIENVTFAKGSFRNPEEELDLTHGVDGIVSNFAMHHLDDTEKKEGLEVMRSLLSEDEDHPGWFTLGDVILFEDLEDPSEYYAPEYDDPSTIEYLRNTYQETGFDLCYEHRISPAAGVLCGISSSSRKRG